MTTQLSPEHLALPPPVALSLADAGREVGWIADDTVGFRGFADETEATHAAWVAYRALARRLARTDGSRPVPIDSEPLAIRRIGHQELILASGRPIATLLRPDSDRAGGFDSFAVEIRVPPPVDELRVRSMAYLMYRTLRKSGVRWTLWTRAGTNSRRAVMPLPALTTTRPGRTSMNAQPAPNRMRAPSPSATMFVSRIIFVAIAIVTVAVLVASAPNALTVPLATVLAAALVATPLVVLVDGWRSHGRRTRRALSQGTPADLARDDRRRREPAGGMDWRVLSSGSLALVLLASIVSEGLRIAFAAAGLAGLFVLRLAAMRGGWVPRRRSF